MKITNQLSIATLVLAGVFATGCSQQQVAGGSQSTGGSQVSGSQQVSGGSQVAGGSQQMTSQQQIETPAPVVVAPAPVAPAPAPVMKPKPRPQGNRWTHTHPAIPHCTNSVTHTHKYSNPNHTHHYSCRGMKKAPTMRKPTVDVEALQRKLKAKGYYKGPIDGVVGPSTRSALQRFMQR